MPTKPSWQTATGQNGSLGFDSALPLVLTGHTQASWTCEDDVLARPELDARNSDMKPEMFCKAVASQCNDED